MMGNTKKSSEQKPAANESEPVAGRPYMPKAYGIPKDKKALLPWSHVREKMADAKYYWICTVSPDGRPHATPVDGLWIDDKLYFGGSTETRRHRNLSQNRAVCVHLESGADVVILHGDAYEMRAPKRSLAIRMAEASKQKYGYGFTPEQYETIEGIFQFRPRVILAWKNFPKDATRWRIEEKDEG
jgi:nitroimidazol reductase NimA-like FMN-containing flavoprotein (pyridoxamine 5'-phosphate oxidase superfamily)